MKKSNLIIIVLLFCINLCYGQENEKLEADKMWKTLPDPPIGTYANGRDTSFKSTVMAEQWKREYRSIGLKFWQKYPNDRRRYSWLLATVEMCPSYWKDIYEGANSINSIMYDSKYIRPAIDEYLLKQWDSVYSKMKIDFLSSNEVSDSLKRFFRRVELRNYINDMEYPFIRKAYGLNLIDLQKKFIKCAEEFYNPRFNDYDSNTDPIRSIDILFFGMDKYGSTIKELMKFADNCLRSGNPTVRKWANAKLSLGNLRIEPFQFRHLSVDGQLIDLELLRGNVVLLDFWATTCTVCIGRMKDIKPVYGKYHEQGFEVVSISIDDEEKLSKIEKIKRKIGANWPTVVIGGKTRKEWSSSLANAICNKYGFRGVPQLLLLDKNGLMVEYNGVLQTGDLEPIVQKLLNQKTR
jgi:thiol-disulfide isomerase/thioredoxin